MGRYAPNGIVEAMRAATKALGGAPARGATFLGPACRRDPAHAAVSETPRTERYLRSGQCVRCMSEMNSKQTSRSPTAPPGCMYPPDEWFARNLAVLRRSKDPEAYLRAVEAVRGPALRWCLEVMWR